MEVTQLLLVGSYVMVVLRLQVHYRQFLVNPTFLIYEIDLSLVQVIVIQDIIRVVLKMQYWFHTLIIYRITFMVLT